MRYFQMAAGNGLGTSVPVGMVKSALIINATWPIVGIGNKPMGLFLSGSKSIINAGLSYALILTTWFWLILKATLKLIQGMEQTSSAERRIARKGIPILQKILI